MLGHLHFWYGEMRQILSRDSSQGCINKLTARTDPFHKEGDLNLDPKRVAISPVLWSPEKEPSYGNPQHG